MEILGPIFISYPHSLSLEAECLSQALGQKGIEVWLDRRNLPGGEPVSRAICQAIQSVRALVVLVARETVTSDYVQFEWSCAQGASIPIIPVAWGSAVELPGPWNRIVTLPCPEGGSDVLADQIRASLLAIRQRPFEQPHHLTVACGDDKQSQLVARLASGDAKEMGLTVWGFPNSLIPGFESQVQLESAVAKSQMLALAVSPTAAGSPMLRHAAGLACGRGKPVVVLNTEPGRGAPWSFLGDIKCLDFGADLETARSDFKRALWHQLWSGQHSAVPKPLTPETLPECFREFGT